MKKIIIIIVTVLMVLLIAMTTIKGIRIKNFSLESYNDVKKASVEKEKKLTKASELIAKTYPNSISKLNEDIKKFKETKNIYEGKTQHTTESTERNFSKIGTYDVEFLWTIIGNYATNEGINLTLDISQVRGDDLYNLSFTLLGSYIGITDFIYDIENDQRLSFKIEDLKMNKVKVNENNQVIKEDASKSKAVSTTTNTNKPQIKEALQAQFVVNNIAIKLN